MNTLGHGLHEQNCKNALAISLRKTGLAVAQQRGLTVYFEDEVIGHDTVGLLVENRPIVELKTVRAFDKDNVSQCANC
jgi:GxxExxY protein